MQLALEQRAPIGPLDRLEVRGRDSAGLHLLVGLPEGIDDGLVAETALAAGVAVQPLSYHRLRPGPPGLVVGYAAVTPDRLHEAVRVLVNAVRTAAEEAGLSPQLPQRR